MRARPRPGRVVAIIVGMALGSSTAPALSSEPKLAFVDTAIQLWPGTASGTRQVLVKAENLPSGFQEAAELQIKDLGSTSASPARVDFHTAVLVDRGTGTRAWLITADVKGLSMNTAQKRFARLTAAT